MSQERVTVFDTTLRDGEQSPGCSMDLNEKLRMAVKLQDLGVDVIEAGFPIASEGDFTAVKAVAAQCREITVAALCRTAEMDVARAAEDQRLHALYGLGGRGELRRGWCLVYGFKARGGGDDPATGHGTRAAYPGERRSARRDPDRPAGAARARPGRSIAFHRSYLAERVRASSPLQIALEPADLAGAYVFLASRANARGITGAIVTVDAGVTLRMPRRP